MGEFLRGLFSGDKSDSNEELWDKEEAIDEINRKKNEKEHPVVEARVRCTCCVEKKSEVFVYYVKSKNVELAGAKEQLNHKDTLFNDTFNGCINTEGGKCSIDILDDEWLDYDAKTPVGDGYALDYDESYMVCLNGAGMIYLSDSGQIRGSMEEELEKELLDMIINEKAFKAMGWAEESGKLKILSVYGDDVFDELKLYMEKYDLVNSVSIKMFLATIRHESGGGSEKLEKGDSSHFNGLIYSINVRGVGLMQVTGATQKKFLEYIYTGLPDGNARKDIIKKYIDGYTNDGNDNNYIDPNTNQTAAEFVAENYAVESAVWFWAKLDKMSYSEGAMKGQSETLNHFATRHSNDNQYNTFAAIQMAVNGTAYEVHALDRFAECKNNCEIKKRPEGGCGGNHKQTTDYCFFLTEDAGNNGGDIYRHDYGPNGWDDREEAYFAANDYCNEMEGNR